MEHPKINILSEAVIGKISAGEVVDRPASAVKELIENSIDAGSDSIEVEIHSAGQSLIRIADNGEGMTLEDAKLACKRHATSKINDIDDLDRISTLGFRGEALSSIAAVSQMDLTSRNESDDAGVYVYFESGQIQKIRPAGRARGTTVEVRNLFYNVPARRKFLKKESTELAEIAGVVGRFVLAHPDIEFKLNHGDRTLLHATKEMGALERIRLVLGADIADHMMEITFSSGKYNISGFVSRPSSTRKDKRAQVFFVNKRFVRSKILSDAAYGAYRSLLERGRYPAVVLHLTVPSADIDVNVHPTKLLVKFRDEQVIRGTVTDAIRAGFNEMKTVSPDTRPEAPAFSAESDHGGSVILETPEVQTEFAYEVKRNSTVVDGGAESSAAIFRDETLPVERDDMVQLGDCYIVRVKNECITIMDQHAAHERILYELFSKAVESAPVDSQNLLFPVRMDLSAGESIIMEKIIDKFKVLGFQIEPFGERSYVVQSVPAVLNDGDIKKVIYDVLSDLSSYDLNKINIIDELIKLTSCRAAIKAGDALTKGEMHSLFEQLKKCSLPFTCPHGRPTVSEITIDELEKRFRRK